MMSVTIERMVEHTHDTRTQPVLSYVVTRVKDSIAVHRTRRELMRLDDRMLEDIGLQRESLSAVLRMKLAA